MSPIPRLLLATTILVTGLTLPAVALADPMLVVPSPAPPLLEKPQPRFRFYQKEVEPAPEAAGIALTPQQFAATFVPVQGKHEAVFIHPFSHQPVRVWFTLPRGPWKVSSGSRSVDFLSPNFGRVAIRFKPSGHTVVERTSGPAFYN